MFDDDKAPLVVDLGSHTIKAGFAGEEEPCAIFPTIIGSPFSHQEEEEGSKSRYVGQEARYRLEKLTVREVVRHGSVCDWEDVEKVLDYTYQDQLRVDPTEHQLLMSEPPLNSKSNRLKMAELMFETFNTPGLHLVVQGVLSLYASDRTTGIVLDTGHGVTQIVPVYEGFALDHAIRRLELGGGELNDFLIKTLTDRGHDVSTFSHRENVGEMKEKLCYVASGYEHEMTSVRGETLSDKQATFAFRDGQTVTMERERFTCPEILFQPGLWGLEFEGVHTLVHQALSRCEMDVRGALYRNILLSGGSTQFPGFSARLQRELELLQPATRGRIRVVTPSAGRLGVWKGGSILASLSGFQKMLATKEEYEEEGGSVVDRKCF